MSLRALAAFATGFAAGWGSRAALGSTRAAAVRVIVTAGALRESIGRFAAEQVEYVQDLIAEGRARFESERGSVELDANARPHIAGRDLVEQPE